METITIKVDRKERKIEIGDYPKDINPIELSKILTGALNGVLASIQLKEKKKEKIIVPEKKIVGV